jgi:hypothetical protein
MARTARRIGSAFLIVGVMLISAEATARIDDRIRLGVPIGAVPDEQYDLTITDSLGRRGRPYGQYKRWHLNRFGFRNARMDSTPPPGCTRIMVLGASESFGLYESAGKEYPAQLEDALSRYGCYEVVNAAVAGLTLPAITQLWNNWGSRFGASVVLVYPSPGFYLANYPPAYHKRPALGQPAAPPRWRPRILDRAMDAFEVPAPIQRWRVARTLATVEANHPREWFFGTLPKERLHRFSQDLDSLVTAIRAHHAEPVLITHAMRFTNPPRPEDGALLDAWRQFTPRATTSTLLAFEAAAAGAVRELGARRDVQVIDAARVMNGQSAWFADFVHFTDSGATVMATLIADRLAPLFNPPTVAGLASAGLGAVLPSVDSAVYRTGPAPERANAPGTPLSRERDRPR